MGTRPTEIGAFGKIVAQNVRRIRAEMRLEQRELAERMTALGRPTPTTAISKIEREERRVDVDDLMALTLALDVSPVTLLTSGDLEVEKDSLTERIRKIVHAELRKVTQFTDFT